MSSDRDALLALYRSARGVRWTRWWNIEADAELSAEEAELSAEENWPGTFFYHARVEQLELDDNNLQGIIPSGCLFRRHASALLRCALRFSNRNSSAKNSEGRDSIFGTQPTYPEYCLWV